MHQYKLANWFYIIWLIVLPISYICVVALTTFLAIFLYRLIGLDNSAVNTLYLGFIYGATIIVNILMLLNIYKSKIIVTDKYLIFESLFSKKKIPFDGIKGFDLYNLGTGLTDIPIFINNRQTWIKIAYLDKEGEQQRIKKEITNYQNKKALLKDLENIPR